MKVDLLYFEGCPSWRATAQHLSELAAGRDVEIRHHLVTTSEQAWVGFRGSPTILVDGRDPFDGADQPFGVSCRVYQTPDGPAGSPTLEQLRTALGLGRT